MSQEQEVIDEETWPDILLTEGEWEWRQKPGNTYPIYQVYTKRDRMEPTDRDRKRVIADNIPEMYDAQAISYLKEVLQAVRLAVAHYKDDESVPECIRFLESVYDKAR